MRHPLTTPFIPLKEEPLSASEQVSLLGGETYSPLLPIRPDQRGFNPGLTYNLSSAPGKYLMTYRLASEEGGVEVSTLHLCGLSVGFDVMWSCALDLPCFPGDGVPMVEDGRLLWGDERLLISYTGVRRIDKNGTTSVRFKQMLQELVHDGEHVFNVLPASNFPLLYGTNNPYSASPEKNWQFFDDGQFKTVYSIEPHVVITLGGEATVNYSALARDWTLIYGEMHGGTPPMYLGGGRWLSFFNSFTSHSTRERRYSIGAYIFQKTGGAYRVIAITDGPLLVGSERDGFLWDKPRAWEPIVVFACGAVLTARSDVLLSYGVNDCFCQIARIPLTEVMDCMVYA